MAANNCLVSLLFLALLLTLSSSSSISDSLSPRPEYVSSEAYPVFWHVVGRNATDFGPNGTLNVEQFGMKGLNYSFCGGIGGKWPMLPDGVNGSVINGGVPQAANLSLHLELTQQHVEAQMSDVDYAGLGIFDFEAWFPIWEDNDSTDNWHGNRYQQYSIQLVKQQHPDWSKEQLEAQAKQEFEAAAIKMFVDTLNLCNKLRPKALWGYYGMPAASPPSDKMLPVWQASGALYPSIYLENSFGASLKTELIVQASIKIAEAAKPSDGPRIPVYPFAWECYHSGKQLLSPKDLSIDIVSPYTYGADGVIIWGSTSFQPQGNNGKNMSSYIDFVRTETGPLVQNFESKVHACSQASCSGHGRCTTLSSSSLASSSCRCFDGYSGPECSTHTL